MSFNVSFMANQMVTDEDINNIGYNLSNTVYTSFTDDTWYGVEELNAITSHMMNKGVKRNYKNECAVTLTDNIVHIDSGLAFFENGAVMTVDDDGIDLTLEDSTETQYIYLFFNSALNVAGARCTSLLPEAGTDYVTLGNVTGGVLTQDRTFAFLNADVKGTNEVVTVTAERKKVLIDGRDFYEFSTPINISGYKKAYFRPDYEGGNYNNQSAFIFGVIDIQNQIAESFVYANKDTSYKYNNVLCYESIANGSTRNAEIIDGILYVRIYMQLVQSPIRFELFGGVEE